MNLFKSYRRRLIDQALFQYRDQLVGKVLDLGGGRTRGGFPHGKELGWIVLDEDLKLRPTVVGDAQKLPFRDSSFDAVKSTELTGYLFEPIKMLQEIARVLKPGGKAVLTAPFLTSYDDQQHDSVRLTGVWWRWAAEQTSLQLIRLESQGYLFTVLADFERYWIFHWWAPIRYLAYLIMFPVYRLLFWWEQQIGVPKYLKRFTTGFLVILKKPDKER